MADKETQPKKVVKTTAATSKPEAKTATPAAKTAAKPTATAATKTTAKTATTAAAKTTAKTATTAATKATAKPTTAAATAKTEAKPASSPAAKTATKPAATPAAKTATKSATPAVAAETAAKPATKVAAKTEAKPKTVAAEKSSAKSATPAKREAAATGGNGIVDVLRNNWRIIAIAALGVILVIGLILGIVLGAKSCKKDVDPGGISGNKYNNNISTDPDGFEFAYKTTTAVGYSSTVLGTTNRVKPVSEVKDGGLPSGYPTFGHTLSSVVGSDPDGSKAAARDALISESSYLTATGTANAGGGGYTWMDENGYLYSGTRAEGAPALDRNTGEHRQLYKHTASIGLYLGDVADDEPGIVKKVTMRPRGYSSYGVTGVYAPAGEVIKIQMSGKDMAATGGIIIHIGQALYNGQANNIWTAKGQMQRIPHLLNTMVVSQNTAVYDADTDTWTAYVGSFIGGPLYIRNESVTFTATISGGCAYRHFILGYTTREEFDELCKSTVPYFDLEVWDHGVLHSGPLTYAKAFSYDELYDAAILWEKVSYVSNYNGDGANCNRGIVFLYDPFVAAGAAVAFPGRNSVNCPMGWMSSSLNYNSIVSSGSWGNFHEYNHNFQNYGIGYTGEITNNGLNLVSYSLFTNISAARQIASFGGAGLSGWNCYTSATWVQRQVQVNNINSTSHLAVYATLLHNLGQENFLNARGYFNVNYLNRWAQITHLDFSYFDQNSVPSTGSQLHPAQTEYPLFVPVASVYQTGRTYNYDGEKREITTMQPYVIPYGQPFMVDLRPYTANAAGQYESGSIMLGASTREDFYYRIKGVSADGVNGTVVKEAENIYTFTPTTELRSGKIYVTLEIYNAADDTRFWNGHALEDVDLVLEFKQSHETNKTVLTRTTYTYTADTMYTDAREAYDAGFSGYSDVTTMSHTNPTQNCNTDIWLYPNTDAMHTQHPDSPDWHFAHNNTIIELKGKLYFLEEGKYRIYLRGRKNCAFYYSLDGGATYSLGGYINDNSTSSGFRPNDTNTYVDVELNDNTWLYFKEVLIVENISNGMASFIGLGYGTWQDPLFTTQEVTDADGNVVTKYYNAYGQEVSEEQVVAAEKIPPTSATYINAFNETYESIVEKFESDYFAKKTYNYNYIGTPIDVLEGKGTPLAYTAGGMNYIPWDAEAQKIDNLFDNDNTTGIHFSSYWNVSTTRPAILAFDIGEEVTANSMVLYTYLQTGSSSKGFPSNLTLEGSIDGTEFFSMGSWTGLKQPAVSVELTFNDGAAYTFRYFRLTATSSTNGRIALNGLNFFNTTRFTGDGHNHISLDSDMFTYKYNWDCVQTPSVFGHAYLGQSGAEMTFEFSGTRLGVLCSNAYAKNFEVYIDGNKVNSIDLKEDDGDFAMAYISEKLSEGKHSVKIVCTGETALDSIVYYND